MTYRIASMDIETYSLNMNAAVAEVGLVIFDIGEPDNYASLKDLDSALASSSIDPVVQTLTLPLPLPEQLMLRRHVDPETIHFHFNNSRTLDPDFALGHTLWPVPERFRNLTLAGSLDYLRSVLKAAEVKELWTNHTTFDCGRLISLAEDLHLPGDPLWHYRIERDLATVRKLVPKEERTEPFKVAHRGLDDAIWNLRELYRVMQYVTPRELKKMCSTAS